MWVACGLHWHTNKASTLFICHCKHQQISLYIESGRFDRSNWIAVLWFVIRLVKQKYWEWEKRKKTNAYHIVRIGTVNWRAWHFSKYWTGSRHSVLLFEQKQNNFVSIVCWKKGKKSKNMNESQIDLKKIWAMVIVSFVLVALQVFMNETKQLKVLLVQLNKLFIKLWLLFAKIQSYLSRQMSMKCHREMVFIVDNFIVKM